MINKKEIKFDGVARAHLAEGVKKVSQVAGATMGRMGKFTIIGLQFGSPKVTKDGYYSIRNIKLEDKFENEGCELAKEGARKIAEEAGDGTTTYTVLLNAIIQKGLSAMASDRNPREIKKGIDKAVKIICNNLKTMAVKIDKDSDMIERVATISANNDPEIGGHIADAMKKLKNNGMITVDESNTGESYIDIVEGMKIDRGYISPYFITNPDKMECILENPYILMHDDQISGIKPILNILEEVTKEGRALLIVAKDVNNEALATIIQNKVKGGLQLACIHAPGMGASMADELEDVALITGGTVVSETVGTNLESCSIDMLGQADKVIIKRHNTVFVGGKGHKDLIETRIKAVEKMIEGITEPYAKEVVEKRLANIDGGVAVYHVGGATPSEVGEKKDLIEDAIAATKSAVEMGVVPGGGSSLALSISCLDKSMEEWNDEAIGVSIVRDALKAPLKQIMENAGLTGDTILDKVLESNVSNAGYDLSKGEICDMMKEGILDTAKVEICALTNAASVANMILMGATVLVDKEEVEND